MSVSEVIARAEIVAMELGFEYLRQVTPTELYRLSKAAPAGTEPNALRSFQRADLVIEALEWSGTGLSHGRDFLHR